MNPGVIYYVLSQCMRVVITDVPEERLMRFEGLPSKSGEPNDILLQSQIDLLKIYESVGYYKVNWVDRTMAWLDLDFGRDINFHLDKKPWRRTATYEKLNRKGGLIASRTSCKLTYPAPIEIPVAYVRVGNDIYFGGLDRPGKDMTTAYCTTTIVETICKAESIGWANLTWFDYQTYKSSSFLSMGVRKVEQVAMTVTASQFHCIGRTNVELHQVPYEVHLMFARLVQ